MAATRSAYSPPVSPANGITEKGRRRSNRDRVREAALELFNAHGYASVTTNHIADHINISPGNLYYHFRNKEQIVESIYRDAVNYSKQSSDLPSGGRIGPDDLAYYFVNSMDTLWRYRSVFGDIVEIGRRNPIIAAEHREFMRWSTGRLYEIFELLGASGNLRKGVASREVLQVVSANTALVITGWWHYLHAELEPAEVTVGVVRNGAVRAYFLIDPYLKPKFAAAARAAIAAQQHEQSVPAKRAARKKGGTQSTSRRSTALQ
jgi:AcrR family transcriptional regulator